MCTKYRHLIPNHVLVGTYPIDDPENVEQMMSTFQDLCKMNITTFISLQSEYKPYHCPKTKHCKHTPLPYIKLYHTHIDPKAMFVHFPLY